MKLIIFLTAIALVQGTQDYRVLKENVHHPYQLALDYETNMLFFSYSSEAQGKTVLKSATLNINTLEFGEVTGIKEGFANAYDRQNHVMYMGGEDGLYAYDYATKTAKNLGVTNYSIWQMFHCPVHGLFFTTSKPAEKAFVFTEGRVKPVSELSDTNTRLIAISQQHDLFFANSTGIFVLLTQKDVHIYTLGQYNINGFASDMHGKLFFSTPDAIYYVNENARKMDKVVSVEDGDSIWGVAVAGDGSIVYALNDKIVIEKK